jgi:hypothetical protein
MRLWISPAFPPGCRAALEDAVRFGIIEGSRGFHSRLFVRVKRSRNGRGHRGRAYGYVPVVNGRSSVPPSCKYLTTMTFPLPTDADALHPYAKRVWGARTWEEAVVFVAAHEGCHIGDFVERAPRKGLERRANAAGRYAVGLWRSLRIEEDEATG